MSSLKSGSDDERQAGAPAEDKAEAKVIRGAADPTSFYSLGPGGCIFWSPSTGSVDDDVF
jgi:hypothetical protein